MLKGRQVEGRAMNTYCKGAFLVAWIALAATAAITPLAAHHADFFGPGNPVVLTGKVVRLELQNPHSWLYVDVKEVTDKTQAWAFDLGPPFRLRENGWTNDLLKTGDEVKVNGVTYGPSGFSTSGIAKDVTVGGKKFLTGR
jgi:hypothetical protein